ncbi:SGNH/GDSL hydrolase family protein [Streptomyces sp. UNOC14_S4]|uniref:SGNH/GDSL hydrolase family protein n=1 Tax=Streptomyces sp. UNOC14_S4 TaxID=2872340 RepID=UPI0035B3DFE4|nr:SGNH/GDSL hydrolase family protein [Streptomyces sp. UNOC14_S4]
MAQAHARGGQYGKALAAVGAVAALAAAAAAPAAAQTPRPGGERYVALGDSYTSGPGIPQQSGGDCLRSSVNYPALTSAKLGTATFKDVSCSGAKTDDMWQAQGANPAQLNTLDKRTTLVTLGIGGNDIGFSGIIETCAKLSASDPAGAPCKKQYTANGGDELDGRIAGAATKVAKVLKGIHQRAPFARVVLVGYPSIMPDNGVGCFPKLPMAAGDVPYLRDTEKKLNAMLQQQAAKAHVRYADTYTPTVGHDVCTPKDDRWVEGVQPENPAAPFHPNAKGEAAMAGAVLKATGRAS